MATYQLTQRADEDLEGIFLYGVDAFGVNQARRYLRGLRRMLRSIADNPLLGSAVDGLGGSYRRRVYRAHVVYYRQRLGQCVLIVRILGRQTAEGALSG